ncbi:DUF7146 domain-containing protein [Maritalea porphyrae]|uniref:DUF7146 domain-containing protein n=1 Tax=Maritalea porphyrae TaxID=880732 RepID=UPI0022AF6193|nr:CHC2 zinc finger domain-containing protein [Maritalea porphyrae]MCZ4274006.1 CHC2 zinc finger domain-containing protein [Maritalea porphyrae]
MNLDHLKNEAQNTSCIDWAERQGWAITKRGNDRFGPCPLCGGTDRFAINISKNVWLCRQCDVGGDVIKLVQHMEGLDYKSALERITGRKAAEPIDPAREAELKAQAEQDRLARERVANRYRQDQIRSARRIMNLARLPKPGGPVEAYLRKRGLDKLADTIAQGRFKILLREIERFERKIPVKNGGKVEWITIDECPVMVGEIIKPNDDLDAVHMTFLDPTTPKGKREKADPNTGNPLPSKIMKGSKKSGAIRLYTPSAPTRLVVGEGIETTLTALQEAYQPNTAYWCGADLGNMAGAAGEDENGKRCNHLPDLNDDEAFVPPAWCKELVLLRDGDSDSKKTDNQLQRCGRRAMALRPGLVAKIANAADGKDFNDMLVEGAE